MASPSKIVVHQCKSMVSIFWIAFSCSRGKPQITLQITLKPSPSFYRTWVKIILTWSVYGMGFTTVSPSLKETGVKCFYDFRLSPHFDTTIYKSMSNGFHFGVSQFFCRHRIPSSKRLHNYGTSPCYQWVNR